jgi:hypothetical protein
MRANQDTLPQGGFGRLIALPLQKQPRELGNSVFVFQQDGRWDPYPDQWAFLSAIQRIECSAVEAIVHEAEAKGRVIGVRLAMVDEDDNTPWLGATVCSRDMQRGAGFRGRRPCEECNGGVSVSPMKRESPAV